MRGQPVLTVAGLSNRATHDGDHDQWSVAQLLERFERARRAFVSTQDGPTTPTLNVQPIIRDSVRRCA
jgi:hypothetical protein